MSYFVGFWWVHRWLCRPIWAWNPLWHTGQVREDVKLRVAATSLSLADFFFLRCCLLNIAQDLILHSKWTALSWTFLLQAGWSWARGSQLFRSNSKHNSTVCFSIVSNNIMLECIISHYQQKWWYGWLGKAARHVIHACISREPSMQTSGEETGAWLLWLYLSPKEQQKYAQLQEIIKKLDEEKKRGDSLLYAMIPKAVADRLRKGITALETCQVQIGHFYPDQPLHSAPLKTQCPYTI